MGSVFEGKLEVSRYGCEALVTKPVGFSRAAGMVGIVVVKMSNISSLGVSIVFSGP